jgi:hypothetical protein
MATAYSPPEGFEPPQITLENMRDGSYEREEAAFLERLADRAKMNGTSPLLGEVVRWSRADGYAQYMVWQTKPLQLIHLNLLDGYSIEPALIRGLRVADIHAMVQQAARMREFFTAKIVIDEPGVVCGGCGVTIHDVARDVVTCVICGHQTEVSR